MACGSVVAVARPAFTLEAGDESPDTDRHRDDLLAIIAEIEAEESLDAATLDGILRRHPRDGCGFFSRAELIAGFRRHALEAGDEVREDAFVRRVVMRPVRSQSGVTPVTILTRPFPCPGRCIFCPNDVRMPKSYLSAEPGAQRAALNRFDAYRQTWSRLEAYRAIGHPTEKIELIVLGGTWSFYPEAYQVGFLAGCFRALNDFGAGIDRRSEAKGVDPGALPAFVDGSKETSGVYNRLLKGWEGARDLADESAGWDELEALQRANEQSRCRSVGLSLETRPDHVTPKEVLRLRRLGATKVQLGVQSLQDEVLRRNQRGHDVAASRRAVALLRAAGFKLQLHWMPNLLGSTPEADRADFEKLFADADFRPDELKLYPCSLIESAELMQHYERGEWRPYNHAELLEVVSEAMAAAPHWVRLSRVIRDISSDDIVAGNGLTNFREIAEAELARQGRAPREIRWREVRGEVVDAEALEIRSTRYDTSTGLEIFFEFVDDRDRLAAFLRLSLPGERDVPTPEEVAGAALIREVHVYGGAVDLGQRREGTAQHRGLGRALIEAAAELARAKGYARLAVISAVGTRPYYRKLGFEDGPLYQHRTLASG
jgi:elongator complex protein 3